MPVRSQALDNVGHVPPGKTFRGSLVLAGTLVAEHTGSVSEINKSFPHITQFVGNSDIGQVILKLPLAVPMIFGSIDSNSVVVPFEITAGEDELVFLCNEDGATAVSVAMIGNYYDA